MTISHADAAAHVRQDLEQGLPNFAIHDFSYDQDAHAASGLEVVVWTAEASIQETFLGAVPGSPPVTIRGVTLVKVGDDGAPLFRRYIDWMDLLNALGLNGVMRPVRVMQAGEAGMPDRR